MTFTKQRLVVAVPVIVVALVIGGGATTVLAGSGNAQGSDSDREFHEREMFAGAKTYKKVQTSTGSRSTSVTSFATLTAGSVPVPPGRTALINVKWAGETSCFGGGTASNWCSMRITVGGVEAHPQSGLNFAIDSTDGGTARPDEWEGHLIERHRCVRNATTNTANFPVVVQWAVVNFDGGSAPTFTVDDWALDIQRADNCSPLN